MYDQRAIFDHLTVDRLTVVMESLQTESSHGGKLDYAPETIGKQPYTQAVSALGNPKEFKEIAGRGHDIVYRI